ncbi:GNAT family N-acetyltransferase [Allorhizocola rhizosphaerae]|uniref:GNAT family N-acetyltransferase n=1 Tax=Allorhizocola rhizosphaerae TaxID=1872709 RepID=UPI0013C2DCE1|nr:GNAT family N-acetyltransferase [Allorhizocola rhizosphaerae]
MNDPRSSRRRPAIATIGRAGSADLPRLARTLAEAFDGDPVWAWMLPDTQRSRERLFGALLRQAIPHGHVYATHDGQAVAMWSPPHAWKVPTSAMLRAALPIAVAARARLPRLLGRLGEIERLHRLVPQNHWYLEFIGTSAAARGAGLGSALINHALEHVTGGLPIYLESSNPRNLTFYQRHGFHVMGEPPMRFGPPQWTLWRD